MNKGRTLTGLSPTGSQPIPYATPICSHFKIQFIAFGMVQSVKNINAFPCKSHPTSRPARVGYEVFAVDGAYPENSIWADAGVPVFQAGAAN